MPEHIDQQTFHYNTQQLFDVVADIESYPEFIPWIAGARVLERARGEVIADLIIRYKGISETFTSHVTLKRPEDEGSGGSIMVDLVDGPFHHLQNSWNFLPVSDHESTVHFTIDFSFRSALLEKMMGFMFEKALGKIMEAFEKRADALYGKGA